MLSALAVFVAFGLAFALTGALARGIGPRMLDHPNDRSLHEVPTPRSGGLAIAAGIALGYSTFVAFAGLSAPIAILLASASLVFAISVVDDLRDVPAGARMLVHAVAAGALVFAGRSLGSLEFPGLVLEPPAAILGGVTVLFVVWMTNLYNFMDGMDGFAGGMGIMGFATYAMLAARAGDGELLAVAAVVAAACTGFLAFNFPPAKIFMGDAGSSVLGFLAAGLALEAQHRGAFPLWISVLVFSPFVVDATVTLLRRALAGEKFWQAHRSHHYQRLVRLGWGHRRTTLWAYALMAACSLTALMAHGGTRLLQASVLAAWVIAYTVLMLFVSLLERRGRATR